jgi:hypothetical protein
MDWRDNSSIPPEFEMLVTAAGAHTGYFNGHELYAVVPGYERGAATKDWVKLTDVL